MISGDSKGVKNRHVWLTPLQVWENDVMDSAPLWEIYGESFDWV